MRTPLSLPGQAGRSHRLTFKYLLRHVALAATAGSLVAGLVYAVTTISTNISTDGTMAVTGRATTSASLVVGTTQPGPWDLGAGDLFIGNEATTTGNIGIGAGSGSDDDSLFFDSASSEALTWLDGRTEFSLSDDLTVSGNATSTGYLVIGATQPIVNMAAGDLLIGAAGTTTGNFAVGGGSGTNDDSLFFDSVSSEALTWLDGRTEFTFTDDLRIQGNATSTGYLVVGTGNPDRNLSAGDAWFGGTASTTALVVSGRATTTLQLVVGDISPQGTPEDGSIWAEGDIYLGNSGTGNSDFIYFDAANNESLSWNNNLSQFELTDEFNIAGNATATGYFVVGTNNPTSNLAAGSLWVGGTASSTNLVVSGRATTTGNLSIGSSNQTANSTTTVTFGSYDATGSNQGVCLKIRQGTAFVWCYFGGAAGTTLQCSTTVNCE